MRRDSTDLLVTRCSTVGLSGLEPLTSALSGPGHPPEDDLSRSASVHRRPPCCVDERLRCHTISHAPPPLAAQIRSETTESNEASTTPCGPYRAGLQRGISSRQVARNCGSKLLISLPSIRATAEPAGPRHSSFPSGGCRVELEDDRPTLAALVRAGAPVASAPSPAQSHRTAVGRRRVHPGSPATGPAPGASRGIRLHRRRRRRRDQSAPFPAGVRERRVQAPGAAGRLTRGPVDDDPREAGGGTARLRPDRIHPHGAHRRRACGRASRGADGHPLRTVHDGDHVHRAARGRGPRRKQMVSAVSMARPAGEPRLRHEGQGSGLRGPRAHCRHAHRGVHVCAMCGTV